VSAIAERLGRPPAADIAFAKRDVDAAALTALGLWPLPVVRGA
jgi:hypothetical protein